MATSYITNATLAQQITDLVNKWTTREAQMRTWLAGTALGGDFGNGTYPLTDYLNNVYYTLCPAALSSLVSGPAAASAASAAAALVSQNAASASAVAALASQTAAGTSATNAASSATTATAQASTSTNSAVNSAASAAAAAASAAAAATAALSAHTIYVDSEPGDEGPPGPPGRTGDTGPQGLRGFPGEDGPQGDDGLSITGPQGPQGFQGAMGMMGFDGDQGEEGMPIPGNTGANGATGAQGPSTFGIAGLDGDQGEEGMPIPGPQGMQGFTGALGPMGFDGDQGEEGMPIQGNQGIAGPTGAQGPLGPSPMLAYELSWEDQYHPGSATVSGPRIINGLLVVNSPNGVIAGFSPANNSGQIVAPLQLSLGTSGGDYPYAGYNVTTTTTTGVYNYTTTDFASRIRFLSGGFRFQTAASGSAGTAITFADALTIAQGGNVTIPAPASGDTLTVTSPGGGSYVAQFISPNSAGLSRGPRVQAGTNVSDFTAVWANAANSVNYMLLYGDGGLTVGAPTGTSQGVGTVNVATGLYINAQPVYAGIPQNLQSVSYTLVLADANKHIHHGSASAHTFTIPANASVAFPIGTAVTFTNGSAGGVVTIAITTDTLQWAPTGGTGSRTMTGCSTATALKVSAAVWIITGSGLT